MVFKQQKDITRDLSMVPMRSGCILHGRRVPRPATYDMDSTPTMSSDGVPLTGFSDFFLDLGKGVVKGFKNRFENKQDEGNEGGIGGAAQWITEKIIQKRDPKLEEMYANAAM